MIKRIIFEKMQSDLFKGKAIILTGPRQVGKTTLLKKIQAENEGTLYLDCDEPDIRSYLEDSTSTELKDLIGNAKIVLIDEAQRVKNIGITLKLVIDQLRDVQLIASGSSSLELSNSLNEPLTGRKFEYFLFPFSIQELNQQYGVIEEKRLLQTRLIYGLYPDIVNHRQDAQRLLLSLTSGYLYKDVFNYQEIRKPELLPNLLEALARQVSQEVSYNELAQWLDSDPVTIKRYIDLLEKSFVIFRLRSFSRNLRNEIKKSRKIYFFDNGIRNALINNFQSVDTRTDIGALWENFLVSERMKLLSYHQIHANRYFWRTQQQQEIDYIEDIDGQLYAYEFKWNPKKKARFSKTFTKNYPVKATSLVNRENYLSFLNRDDFQ
jgi:predicted AAA+ superfamily ATPase